MARLVIEGGDLVVRLGALEMMGAFHSSVRVPLTNVASLESSESMWGQLRGMRLPGTGIPRVIALGVWRADDGKDFVAIYRSQGVVVTVRGSSWSRLLVSCQHPQRVCDEIDAQK